MWVHNELCGVHSFSPWHMKYFLCHAEAEAACCWYRSHSHINREMLTQACAGTQMRLYLHPSQTENNNQPMLGTIFLFAANSADTDFSLHCQELISLFLFWLTGWRRGDSICLLASTPSSLLPPSPPSISSIVAISCLLCMDFDCSQGAILHVAQTHTYMHRRGEKKILAFRGFVYQMCCQIMSGISCQGTFYCLRLPKRKDSN